MADGGKLAELEQFLTAFVGMHPGAAATVYARYYLGSIAFLRGDFDSSAAQFRAGIQSGKGDEIMPFLLRTGLAQALEAKGDFGAASEAYREAAAAAGGELRAQARMGQARATGLGGRSREAAVLYRQILTETGDPRLKELIEVKLAQAE
jgi:hypothetical protein